MKSVHFGSQVAGMPCQNNHFWLDFGYRDVGQPCLVYLSFDSFYPNLGYNDVMHESF